MKWTSVISAIILSVITLNAQDRKGSLPAFTFGAEWGYVATFQCGYHNNFFAPEGYRVDDRGNVFGLYNNSEAYLHVGYNLNAVWNLSLYIGYAGMADTQPIIPVSVRGTRFFGSDHLSDRWFCFADLGSGVGLNRHPQEILSGRLGGGYRLSMSRLTKLDLIASLRMTYAHNEVDYKGTPIAIGSINRNNVYASALSLGISITF